MMEPRKVIESESSAVDTLMRIIEKLDADLGNELRKMRKCKNITRDSAGARRNIFLKNDGLTELKTEFKRKSQVTFVAESASEAKLDFRK